MGEISDSTLMAYADGELEPELRSTVEALLAADPVVRERLAAFMETGRQELAPLFDSVIGEPVPAHLYDVVREFPLSHADGRPASLASSSTRVSALGAMLEGLFAPPAIAWGRLAFALLLGVSAGWIGRAMIGHEPSEGQIARLTGADVASAPLLLHALESTPSGIVVSQPDAAAATVSFKVILSFLSRDQHYCRQYEMTRAGGAEFGGFACRSDDNVWRIGLHTRTPTKGNSRGITPAGEANPVNAAVQKIMPETAEPLLGESEEELIRNRWRARR
jgi:hypothetical protein